MIPIRRLALLMMVFGTFAVAACDNPSGVSIERGVTCNPLQAGCSGD
jgi:hypothetical protein